MARTIDEYLDAALEATGIKSDNALGRALGISGSGLNHWRTKKAWPSDSAMIALATMADMDPDQALIDLNIWRAKSSAVVTAYQRIADQIKNAPGAAASIAVLLVFLFGSPDVQAREHVANKGISQVADVYIMRLIVTRLSTTSGD